MISMYVLEWLRVEGLPQCKMGLKQSFDIIKIQSILKDFAAILWKIVAQSTTDNICLLDCYIEIL